jgi:hypothetical protein
MVYKFATSSGFSGDAKAVYDELESIRQSNNGQLKTISVVDAARESYSPLHPHFEWDDWKAAEAHRQNTARRLIRAIIVKPEKHESENNISVHRAFISVKSNEQNQKEPIRYYQNIADANRDEFDSAIDQFKNKLSQLGTSLRQVQHYAATEQQKTTTQALMNKTKELEELAETI